MRAGCRRRVNRDRRSRRACGVKIGRCRRRRTAQRWESRQRRIRDLSAIATAVIVGIAQRDAFRDRRVGRIGFTGQEVLGMRIASDFVRSQQPRRSTDWIVNAGVSMPDRRKGAGMLSIQQIGVQSTARAVYCGELVQDLRGGVG